MPGPAIALAVDQHLAVGREEAADDVEQRALAAAGRTDDRDELALGDREIDASEREHRAIVAAIGFGDPVGSRSWAVRSSQRARLRQILQLEYFDDVDPAVDQLLLDHRVDRLLDRRSRHAAVRDRDSSRAAVAK